jgi:hypothetical protein
MMKGFLARDIGKNDGADHNDAAATPQSDFA